MKGFKKFTALILALLMIVSVNPLSVFAGGPDKAPKDKGPKAEAPKAEPVKAEKKKDPQAVGKTVIFSASESTVFYKKDKMDAQTKTYDAASLMYVDATVKSVSETKDGAVFYKLQTKGAGNKNKVNLEPYCFVLADCVQLTDNSDPIQELKATVGKQKLTVLGRLPKDTSLRVSLADTKKYEAAMETAGDILSCYDITLKNKGVEIEPLTPVLVKIENFVSPKEPVRVYHILNEDPENFSYISAEEIVYDKNSKTLSFLADGFSSYLVLTDDEIVAAINAGLHLADSQPMKIYKAEEKNKVVTHTEVTGKVADVSLGGTIFTNYFYYAAVAKDPEVPFSNAATYQAHLVQVYKDAYDAAYEKTPDDAAASAAALQAVKKVWDYYLADLYDPEYAWMNDTDYYKHYTPNSMGDNGFEWPKSNNNYSSFHYDDTLDSEKILPLEYNFLEGGVDYSQFVSKLNKTATAVAAGDANTERKYDIAITADAQAKVSAPVVMIFQLQTAWQLFDLEHANKLKAADKNSKYIDDNTEVGAVANSTEMATLYDVKHALIDFVDYMKTNYPGNNLFLGFTETKHDQSSGMLHTGSQVTNNETLLENALITWDTFGNCEHVHYDSEALQNVVNRLESDLSVLQDVNTNPIPYDQISKTVVVIGGPTENSTEQNGYGCTLPWVTFSDNKIDAVYGIRVNDGTSYVTTGTEAGVLSWLDYSKNNSGDPYYPGIYPEGTKADDKNSTPGNFTKKFVATTRDAVFNALVAIAEEQMKAKGLDVQNPAVSVDHVTISDTITPEFLIDDEPGEPGAPGETAEPAKHIYMEILDKDGNVVRKVEYPKKDAGIGDTGDKVTWTRTENKDGSITISCDVGSLFNTQKAVLHIPVVAKEDYIGSNNVKSNVGTPDASYEHLPAPTEDNPNPKIAEYTVDCHDTPEVNVPIRFNTEDGGNTTIWVGDSVDLKDLDSDSIIADVMDRIDNYEQINGTVSFTWVLPDGSKVEIPGGLVVKNGVPDFSTMPDISCEELFDEEGNFVCTLEVTFTPNDVKNNGNFSDQEVTAVPVNPLTKDGDVFINTIMNTGKVSLYVRKDWKDSFDHSADTVEYILYANDEIYHDEKGQTVTGVLDASNGWENKIEDLPSAITVDDQPEVIKYSVKETNVKYGYEDSYLRSSQTDEVYEGYLQLTLNPGDFDPKNLKFVHIEFSYGGVNYNYDYPLYIQDKDPDTQKLAKKTDKVILLNLPTNIPVTYSGADDQTGTPGSQQYEVNGNAPLSDVVISNIFLYKNRKCEYKNKEKIWVVTYEDQFPKDKQTFTTVGAAVVPKWKEATTSPVLIIENTPQYFYVVHHIVHKVEDELWQPYYQDYVDAIPMFALKPADGKFDITVPFTGSDDTAYYSGIRDGYIYGGMYKGVSTDGEGNTVYIEENPVHDPKATEVPDVEFTTPEDRWCGKELSPEAWHYYYLREVSEEFLQPRLISLRRYSTDTHVERYLLTAVDSDGADQGFYTEYGFIYDPNCEEKNIVKYMQAGVVATGENEELYSPETDEIPYADYPEMHSLLYEYINSYHKNVLQATYTPTKVFSQAGGFVHITDEDYFGCVPYNKNFGSKSGSKTALGKDFSFNFSYTPYYVTADGVFVSGIYERYVDTSNEATVTASVNCDELLASGSLTYKFTRPVTSFLTVDNSYDANPDEGGNE